MEKLIMFDTDIVSKQKRTYGKVLIWGCGKALKKVIETINYETCIVSGLVDTIKRGKWGDYEIIPPEKIKQTEYDLIIISKVRYKSILEMCLEMGIHREQLYVFWDEEQCESPFINEDRRQIIFLKLKLETQELKLLNLPYEYGYGKKPKIKSRKETLYEILIEHKSLCRFGDGEFELIRGKERPWFQKVDPKLTIRLRDILQSDDPEILIAIADDFGNLEKFTDDAARAIRQYITNGTTRTDIIQMLHLEKDYYNAFVSRPYLIYKDKMKAKEVFDLMRQIWKNRNVILIEGKNSYIGIGNDLFETALNIRRIICPEKDAFDRYEDIFKSVCHHARADDLVLISLGPVATVLAYDIAKIGIQAIDIGQVDNEYDWYNKGSIEREEIPGKCVAELLYWQEPKPVQNPKYQREIIDKIL